MHPLFTPLALSLLLLAGCGAKPSAPKTADQPAEWSACTSLPARTPPRKVNGKQFDQIHSGLTLRELVTLLGRGWMPGHGEYEEGCGIIRWTCEDGREL